MALIFILLNFKLIFLIDYDSYELCGGRCHYFIIFYFLFAPEGGMLVQVLGALLQNSINVFKCFWKLGFVWPPKNAFVCFEQGAETENESLVVVILKLQWGDLQEAI